LFMQPALHIDLFGDFRIHSGDELLAVIPQARQQALLVYLLLHRSAPQPRAHVAFLLWPDSSEAQALSNLRKMLTHLRQTAAVLAQALYADNKVIQWRPAAATRLDVADFEIQLAQANAAEQAGCQRETVAFLAAAVELYAGPLVPGCYDDWIIAERERCQQLCLNALERLTTLYESQGDLTTAIHYAQQLLRLDPLQESIYLQLMRLQALHGDRAGALRTYHTCATILERELAVEPGPEIQDAYARLLKLAPAAASQTTGVRRAQATSVARLVGRQAEWTQLQSAWRSATQHRAHFVCIFGEAGIGKTHLAEEMFTWASQQGFVVARSRSYAGKVSSPMRLSSNGCAPNQYALSANV
jgi:DNA-binding SARP family transcriptional activator